MNSIQLLLSILKNPLSHKSWIVLWLINPIDKFLKELFKKKMIPFLALATSGSPDILLSSKNLILEYKKWIVLYILRISMSRKVRQDHIFSYFLHFFLLLSSLFYFPFFPIKKNSKVYFFADRGKKFEYFSIYFFLFIYLSDF